MLDYIHSWCRKWRLRVNTNKSKIIHYRTKRRQRTQFLFKMGNIYLDMVTVYKYLGLYFDEFLILSMVLMFFLRLPVGV